MAKKFGKTNQTFGKKIRVDACIHEEEEEVKMPLRESVIRAKAKGNDIKRRLLLPLGFRIFFLKRGGETKKFVVIREVTAGATIKYSDWRQQLVLNVCTLDGSFDNDVAQTSYWACGVGYGLDKNIFDVYAVDPQRRDVVPPTANNAAWKFFLTRNPKESFTLDIPPPPLVPAFEVTSVGEAGILGLYYEMGVHNGKPYYTLDAGPGDPWNNAVTGFYTNGVDWAVSIMSFGTQYVSSENVATPLDVVTWDIIFGALPTPTIV